LNTQDFKEYYLLIEKGKLPLNRGLVRRRDDQLRWCLVLPLKNREVYKAVYEKQTGMSLENIFRRKIERLKKFGLLYEDDKVLRLTELGSFFSDEVCEQFHHPDYMPFPKSAYAAGELCPYDDWEPTP
jgi:oxygen-independent coproporphyrinogen-3 oxidase